MPLSIHSLQAAQKAAQIEGRQLQVGVCVTMGDAHLEISNSRGADSSGSFWQGSLCAMGDSAVGRRAAAETCMVLKWG